jgi:hypothetical protein
MGKNNITGDSIITKSSNKYSDNFESVFGKKKVIYAVEYTDGHQDYMEFETDREAYVYYIKHKDTIVVWEKQELLLG